MLGTNISRLNGYLDRSFRWTYLPMWGGTDGDELALPNWLYKPHPTPIIFQTSQYLQITSHAENVRQS